MSIRLLPRSIVPSPGLLHRVCLRKVFSRRIDPRSGPVLLEHSPQPCLASAQSSCVNFCSCFVSAQFHTPAPRHVFCGGLGSAAVPTAALDENLAGITFWGYRRSWLTLFTPLLSSMRRCIVVKSARYILARLVSISLSIRSVCTWVVV